MPRLNPFALGRTKLTKLWQSAIDGHVVSLAWSEPLGLLAAASVDGPIALFDVKTGQVRFNLPGHGFGTACVAWSPDGQHLASGGQDGKVRLWDPAIGQQTHEMPAGAAWVERVAWCPAMLPSPPGRGAGAAMLPSPPGRGAGAAMLPSPPGRGAGGAGLLASAAGKKLRLWNADGTMVREYADHPSTIADIQWKPNEAILASTAYGKVFLWDCLPSPEGRGGNAPIREFTWQGSMLALAWSPNAEYIAAGAQDNSVHFWLMKTGDDLQMHGYPVKVRELSWDAQSRYLATGGGPTPCVWDCSGKGPAGTEPIQLDAHKANVTCLAFQHRGALLASGGEDGLVALWQPGKQEGAAALAKHGEPIAQLLWSADDQHLAIGTALGSVRNYTIL